MEDLALDYETARLRMVRELKRLPELPERTLSPLCVRWRPGSVSNGANVPSLCPAGQVEEVPGIEELGLGLPSQPSPVWRPREGVQLQKLQVAIGYSGLRTPFDFRRLPVPG